MMVPMRPVFEELGAQVVYEPATRRVLARRGERNVVLHVGTRTAYVNGERYLADARTFILNGRVMVPLRFLAESLDVGVAYAPLEGTIDLHSH